MFDDKQLIQECIKGNRVAQKQLYSKFAGKLYAVALRYMKNKPEADDVLQDAFVKIFGNLSSFRSDCPFELWVRRIVINTALTALNRRKINYDITETVIDEAYFEENYGLNDLSYGELLAMINELPEGCKTIFNLYAIEGYKHQEIAEMLHISEGTSKSQFSRARVMLMEKLNNNRLVADRYKYE